MELRSQRIISNENSEAGSEPVSQQKTNAPQDMSEYERQAQQNRLDRIKLLDQFGITDALHTLKEISFLTPKRKAIKKVKDRLAPTMIRRSLRLQEVKPEFSYNIEIQEKINYSKWKEENLPSSEPTDIVKVSVAQDDVEKESLFISSLRNMNCNGSIVSCGKSQIVNNCKGINELTVAKMAQLGICSVAFHPNEDRLLVFTGSKNGNLGIWDVNQEDTMAGLYSFKIHSSCIYGMSFNADHSNTLFTSSYDGTFRKFDLNSSIVEQIYQVVHRDTFISSHCQISPSSFLVCGSRGFIDQVDLNNPKAVISHLAHNGKKIKVVTSHPKIRHYFATGGLYGNIMLWDLRKMKPNCPIEQKAIGRSISGLEFSHLGHFLLSTSWDNTIRTFPYESGSLKSYLIMKHNNYTGRFLTPFRASWLPGRDDLFVVGSLTQPRKIELYDCDGTLMHNFMNENLQSVCSINAFHPSLPILAGGNSSGRLHLFRNTM